ncbi:bifunctional riboflavin kinase/FAD synthetase [Thalassotalea ponticola]|uniref:bifunctional riboflavin kinase/FAD synthetase n=1 Tax=Thalassotalea ponticola TaxID=1523392 RepID=UPI0025B3B8C7|nr:bifunctional riboflavin kinase/FAD synthetase [Thalassotalea ponticola]MDN3651711.1 bifunctional riboflavin kinase/FAD synthetase [Thalassotalea ponticola]
MQLVRGIHNIRDAHNGCVLTIGNFDGVHLGHQRVIKALVAKAKEMNLMPAVMVFEPQPQELFNPQSAPARLSRLRDKYSLLKELGVKRLICVNFNFAFAAQSPEQFVEQLLVQKLGVKHLIIGDDFRFGKNRLGDFSMLQRAGQTFGFGVTDTKSFKLDQCRISSTEIRKALQQDDLAEAQTMLGRKYSIRGRVVHGDKQGRHLGFPTANVLLKRCVSPIRGVYIVQTHLDGLSFFGIANIGSRPTVRGTRQQLEVHIFDFKGDLYGKQIEVVLLHKLRDEQRFASISELTAQISRDAEQARQYCQQLG